MKTKIPTYLASLYRHWSMPYAVLGLGLAVALLLSTTTSALANPDAAKRIAERSTGGKALSVKCSSNGSCRVKVLLSDGRVRVVSVNP